MTWGKLLQPDLILGETVIGITPDLIQQQGLRGIVLDVDETLVPLRLAETTPEVCAWLEQLKLSADIWLVSNNLNEPRIQRIAAFLSVPYISGAGKPSRRKLRQAIAAMNLPVNQIAMVGDRLFTDVLVGNRLGMFTILVEPMLIPGESVKDHPIRTLEVWLTQLLGITLQTRP
ncbi:MAG: YqeG family HAD IIIA-type phosphatase [Cyanobacteria bacterium Co-bin13]|nr:YqeG family HAD IIIA-type phosphatase [Cyanobacteria bacterium Co-bin13]